ncbi:MAG: phosphoribosylanthranilate isomerase [Cellulosilyticaceae bacterium]
MCQIKICGITRQEEIGMMNVLKPDYIGFVFAPSRRVITPSVAKVLRKALAPGIKVVGVFVAGGITPENVHLVMAYSPYGIDVSSGVERDGKKDYLKVKQLIEKVRAQECPSYKEGVK